MSVLYWKIASMRPLFSLSKWLIGVIRITFDFPGVDITLRNFTIALEYADYITVDKIVNFQPHHLLMYKILARI